MNKLKGIHFGSYWMGTNDVVCLMGLDLKDLCDLTIVDTDIYSGNKEEWYSDDYSYSSKRPIRWLNEKKVLDLVEDKNPNFIIINSGGMSLLPSTIQFLEEKQIINVVISLSDPDVFFENGKIYSEYYDLCYTNSLYALDKLYPKNEKYKLLPFATSTKLYKPLNNVDKTYDIVVAGHARLERVKIIKKLSKYFNIGLFGDSWGTNHKCVHGEEHVKAINSGKLYLSFSETAAGYTNVKVGLFEAIACKSCVVTTLFEELELYFKYGIDILGYTDDEMLVELVNTYINNYRLRNWIADNAYKKFIEKHTWTVRLKGVLDDIQKCRLG